MRQFIFKKIKRINSIPYLTRQRGVVPQTPPGPWAFMSAEMFAEATCPAKSSRTLRPCLVSFKLLKVSKISHRIESLDACIEVLNIGKK
jgi:hypothetical protein